MLSRMVLHIAGWAPPTVLALMIIARCIVTSDKKPLWNDELFVWYPTTSSFWSMLSSTTDTISGAPPLYFIVAWFWGQAFGASPLSLRLISAMAVSVAILVMFRVLSIAYGAIAASFGLVLAFGHPTILHQSSEIRFHAVFLAEIAVAILLYQRLMTKPPTIPFLIANTMVHAAMVMTHYLALLYSGAILAAAVLGSAYCRRNQLRLCISIVAGWLVFLPWIPAFLTHASMGKPTIWIPMPEPVALKVYYLSYFDLLWWTVAIGFAATFLLMLAAAPRQRWPDLRLRPREMILLLLATCIMLTPIAIYAFSRISGTSIFLWNYMVPCALGWSIICAQIARIALRLVDLAALTEHRRALSVMASLSIATLAGWSIMSTLAAAQAMIPQPIPADIATKDYPDDPIVIEHIHEFMQYNYYSANPKRYRFLLDPEVGIKEGGGGPLNHKNMAAMKRQFPDRFPGVVQSGDFLAGTDSFWVKRSTMLWWPMRMEHNPDFVVDRSSPPMVHVRRREP